MNTVAAPAFPSVLDLYMPASGSCRIMDFDRAWPLTTRVSLKKSGLFTHTTMSALQEAIGFFGFSIEALKKDGTPYRGRAGEVHVTVDQQDVVRAAIGDCRPCDGATFSEDGCLFKARDQGSSAPVGRRGVFLPNGSEIRVEFFAFPPSVDSAKLTLQLAHYLLRRHPQA